MEVPSSEVNIIIVITKDIGTVNGCDIGVAPLHDVDVAAVFCAGLRVVPPPLWRRRRFRRRRMRRRLPDPYEGAPPSSIGKPSSRCQQHAAGTDAVGR